MPNILALDCSLAACSAALSVNNNCYQRYQFAPKQHSELLLYFIDELLSEAKINLRQLDGIAFGAGPGAFTGLRIAASVVQGLAFGTNLPVVPVSSLQAMAQGCWRQQQYKKVLVAVDARMNELYWGGYQITSQQIMLPVIHDQLIHPESLPDIEDKAWYGIGDGWSAYDKKLLEHYQAQLIGANEQYYPNAIDVITLAKIEFAAGNTVTADKALPVYLRDRTAWKEL